MAKILDFTTPTGQKGNLLNVGSWLQMVIGVVVFLITLALGSKLFSTVETKTGYDFQIPNPVDPVAAPAARDPYAWQTP